MILCIGGFIPTRAIADQQIGVRNKKIPFLQKTLLAETALG